MAATSSDCGINSPTLIGAGRIDAPRKRVKSKEDNQTHTRVRVTVHQT